MILVIDNYDSFVHNLARYFRLLGRETIVVRNDQISAQQVISLQPEAIVLSPGPCTPDEAGCSLEVVRECFQTIPILGVCLGHQTIMQALGGKIVRAERPRHGQSSEITHLGSPMFKNVPSPFIAGRYHSLCVDHHFDKIDEPIQITAQTDSGTIMAVEHSQLPVVGLQFHPESILTPCGMTILNNFLNLID